jgi:hypothetical protein
MKVTAKQRREVERDNNGVCMTETHLAGMRASQLAGEANKGWGERRGSLKIGGFQATLDSGIVGDKSQAVKRQTMRKHKSAAGTEK